jgi:hypothetical protein
VSLSMEALCFCIPLISFSFFSLSYFISVFVVLFPLSLVVPLSFVFVLCPRLRPLSFVFASSSSDAEDGNLRTGCLGSLGGPQNVRFCPSDSYVSICPFLLYITCIGFSCLIFPMTFLMGPFVLQ